MRSAQFAALPVFSSIVNVRIWTLDAPALTRRIAGWAERLGEDDATVVAVVLFGSLARGDATAASDADVLVLLSRSELAFDERASHLKPTGLGAPVEIFAYTLAEAERSMREGWGITANALREGRVLFERDGGLEELRALAESH